MTTGFIICGALAREALALIEKYGWDAKVIGVSAQHHMRPERIAPDVAERIRENQDKYARLIVVFGDCGTYGALDKTLAAQGVERIAGPHCYEMYGGPAFQQLMDEEPGTFFLTDFLVRRFRGTVLKGLGLDKYPQLRDDYFRHYRRVVYLAQTSSEELNAKAEEIAGYLELPLEIRHTGYNLFEKRLVALMNGAP